MSWRPALVSIGLAAALASFGSIRAGAIDEGQAVAPQAPAAGTPGAARGASPFVPPEPLDFSEHAGWTSLFDGTTLNGWSGNPQVWRVENGAIVAESTAEKRVGSTHII